MKFKTQLLLAAPLALGALSGCTRDGKFQPVDMWNGARLRPYEGLHFFPNNSEAQVPPAGTVARSENRTNEPLYYGTQNGELITYNPLMNSAARPDDRLAIIQRGQERYQIYCQPCHGLGGYGDGLIVKRGLSAPPSYHIPRLLNASDGHIYDVIANGYGSMYSYGSRVPTKDRWAIVAYVRALQLSQRAPAGAIPAGQKVPDVVPPLNNERKYIGPAGGGAYHDSGMGNANNASQGAPDNPNFGGLGQGANDGSTPTAQIGQPGRAPASPEQGSSPSPYDVRPNGSGLLPPRALEGDAKKSVTTPALPLGKQ